MQGTRISHGIKYLLFIIMGWLCFSLFTLKASTLGAANFETYVSDDGEPARINALLEDVFQHADLDVTLLVMRDAFLGSAVLTGKIDGEFAYINLGEDSDQFLLSRVYLPVTLYAVSKDPQVSNVKLFPHLKGSRVAIENRFANTPHFRVLKDIKFSRNPTTFDAFKQLADDRAPYLITTELLAREFNIMLANDNEETLHFSAKPLVKTGLQLAISKKVSNATQLIERFNNTVENMQNIGKFNLPLNLAWLSKDINGDGVADYIGHSSITRSSDDIESAFSLDHTPTSEASLFVIDGISYSSLSEAQAVLPKRASLAGRESLLDKTTYQQLLRRW